MFISPNHIKWKRWVAAVGVVAAVCSAPTFAKTPSDVRRAAPLRQASSGRDERQPRRPMRDRRRIDRPGDMAERPGRDDAWLGGGRRDGRRGGFNKGPGGPPPWQELEPRRREEVAKFVEEHFPQLWVEMTDLRDRNPNLFRRRMRRLLPDFARLMDTVRRHPEKGALLVRERQLHLRIRHLGRDYRAETAELKRQQMRQQMHEFCGQAFDCELQRRAMEVRELEARLGMFKERIAEQQRMREELITKRAERALSQNRPGLGPHGPHGRPHAVENEPQRE